MYITYNNLIRFSGALNAPRMAVPKGVRGISLVRQMKLSLQRWEWKKEEEEGEKKRRRRRKKKRKKGYRKLDVGISRNHRSLSIFDRRSLIERVIVS